MVRFPIKSHWSFSYRWLFDLFLTRVAVLLNMKYEPDEWTGGWCALVNSFICPHDVFRDLCDFYTKNAEELDQWRRWIDEK